MVSCLHADTHDLHNLKCTLKNIKGNSIYRETNLKQKLSTLQNFQNMSVVYDIQSSYIWGLILLFYFFFGGGVLQALDHNFSFK